MPWIRIVAISPAVLAALAVFAPSSAHADPYRWCAVYSGTDGGDGANCGFVTLEQCRATISGIGGYCGPNPFYSGPQEKPGRRARKRDRD